ncbi:MAG TPA: S9 family peptidase [Pyrinomonadaceae bacterium]|jgi:dipeptidyl aminopeptidase/acylaminoacyl peptidase|nr:S9 family peptidase [Pyrinomonadaceae bacterium]
MRRTLFLIFLILITTAFARALTPAADPSRHVPTIDELLTIKSIGGVQISPDGKWVAYTVTNGDFKQDAFVTQIWLAETSGKGQPLQLTRGDKSSTNPRWAPDGSWLAFTSNRIDDKNQIFLINPAGGEAVQLTKSETSISGFAWSEDGRSIAYTATEPVPQVSKDRKDYLGDYEVVRRDYNFSHLWTLDVSEAMKSPLVGKQRTKKKDFSVDSFSWSPDGSKIAFSATVNPDLIQGVTSDIYLLNLADDRVTKLVSQTGPDTGPRWSPDGKQIVFSTVMGQTIYFHNNGRLAVVPAAGGTPRSITDNFDENANLPEWRTDGVYFTGQQKTASHLFRVDPLSEKVTRVSGPDSLMAGSFSLTRDGRQLAFTAASPTSLNEVFVSDVGKFSPRVLTSLTEQTKALKLGTREVISWKSTDGTTIEGVLIKPGDFDPTKKYPLLCVIHGGPTGVDRPALLTPDARYYPSDIWAARGALILKVNYRGSVGYGEKFRQLNVRNLGVGDAWDVVSGVDYLISKGWVDKSKVGCMGWSQGGYISAFLTASSDRFVAISVGAGISDWSTYYYNTDITPFTINYLGKNPVEDPEIYQKTSPISYIKNARTPTLIQHGELDRRVPIANAYELRQALEDKGVPVEMIVYKGFGHPITKPKAMRAVMNHNLSWFNHYLWNDPLPDFANPVVPQQKESKDADKKTADK